MEQINALLHDPECERQVLGVLMQYSSAFSESSDIISEDMFFESTNRVIYSAIKGVVSEGDTPDLIQVNAYITKHPVKDVNIEPYQLAEITTSVASSVTFHQNCHRLCDLYRRRQMNLLGYKLINAGTSELGDTDTITADVINSLQSLDEIPQNTIVTAAQAIKSLDEIVKGNISGARKNGIPTGFQFLDDKGGLQLTDLVVIAAEFSQGKTSLALDLCVTAARSGHPTAFYSTEMQSSQLVARMLAADSGMSSRVIMQQPMTDEQMQVYDRAIGRMENLPIYFDDTSTLSVERIISSIRSMTRKKGVKVAFIDYLQVLQNNERNMKMTEEQFFGLVARKFKNLAKQLKICIVLMSQIARSKETTEPTLSRIRGSGQICEAADVVLLIFRPEFYNKQYSGIYANVSPNGTAQIKLAKGRNIGTGDFICGYDAPTTHFYELSSIPYLGKNDNSGFDEDRPF